MAVDRRARGHAVEVAARELLRRAGLTGIAANANYRGGELDLVMLDATRPGVPAVVFVEVRYRQSQAFGGGTASIDIGKRRRLVHAAQRFHVARVVRVVFGGRCGLGSGDPRVRLARRASGRFGRLRRIARSGGAGGDDFCRAV